MLILCYLTQMAELFWFNNIKPCTTKLVRYTGGTKSSGTRDLPEIFAQPSLQPDSHRKLVVETLLSEGHAGALWEDFPVAEEGLGENQYILFRVWWLREEKQSSSNFSDLKISQGN